MKNHLVAWVNPFTFKDNQQDNLLSVLPRRSAKDKEAAKCFIEAARREIEVWLSVDIQLLTTAPSLHKEKLDRLTKAVKEYREALDDIPADTGAMLRARIATIVLCEPYKRMHADLAHELELLGMHDPLSDGLQEEILDLVEEAVSHMTSNLDVRRGVNNNQMISLTAKLANAYSRCFQKEPSAGNGSNFRNFMSVLSGIIGESNWKLTDCFGAQTVKDALQRRAEISNRYAASSAE